MTDDQLRKVQLDILAKFDKVCEENGLTYSIDAGTLLGAVRHGGYIPWDDDIDVMMLRDDYEKLMALQYEDDEHIVKNYQYSKDYYYIFAKMMDKRTYIDEKGRPEKNCGVYIDIFPMDLVDDDEEGRKRLEKTTSIKHFVNRLTVDAAFRDPSTSTPKYVLKRFVHIFSDPMRKAILKKLDTMNIRPTGEYCNKFVYGDKVRLYKASIFDEIVVMDFENLKVKAIKDYDTFLTIHYGDYMKLPPENQRIAHHGFTPYFKD